MFGVYCRDRLLLQSQSESRFIDSIGSGMFRLYNCAGLPYKMRFTSQFPDRNAIISIDPRRAI